ncbi:SCP160 protein [Mycena sp. CBHHK59/15]|nr:SCP160 protein [Mycena sp. CBHHK59/15]
MALSAADLQRRHNLEGAPDPFPSLADTPQPKARHAPAAFSDLDTDSQSAFPSLASATPPVTTAPKSAWANTRPKPVVKQQPVFADSFTIGSMDLSNTGKDGKPATLGEVMKQVMAKYKVKLEASANQKTRQTTFHIKAETQKELDKAKRSLLALLSPVITLTINAPASTIASIIGPKGATLKQIRDQTSVRVDIPPRNTLEVPNGNGHVNGKVTPSQDDEEDEITVPVTLTGPQPLAYEAQALLKQIISSKTSKSTQRVRDIPSHILPYVVARKSVFQSAAAPAEVGLALNSVEREVTITGDREAVGRVIESIKSTIEHYSANLTSLKIQLPKRQHRLLAGKAIDEIVGKTRCVVVVAKPDEQSNEVTVWGQSNDLPGGLAAVMEKANSQYIHEFPLPGPITLSKQLLTYMVRIQYPKTLSAAHPGVAVYTPAPSVVEKASLLNIDIIGPKADVDGVVRQVSELIGKLIGATQEISVDWLVHRFITGKNAKKLKQFHETHNVQAFFPPESAEQSTVLLVYDPLSPNASPSPDEKKRHLEEVAKEILKFAKDAADVKSETIAVEKRWHDAVVGKGGTTLNAIIGEDNTLSIKVGVEAGDPSGEDVILLRGVSGDVDRAVKEVLKIVENAKNDEIVNSYSTEFDIDREFVGRIVGAQGAGVNKLRDQLGVKVDVSDEADDKEKETSKKKKATHQKSKVKITGRKENVEEAKKRILVQIERLADETSEVLKIPSQYHSSLIGQSGKYAIRLEDKYSVKITFPRQSAENGEGKTREALKADEVLVKGGKKGVAAAKAELLDAVEFEKESNNVLKFTVPNRAVARILGRGGASINEIKDATDAQIDVDKAVDDTTLTNITVRGTKKAVAAAKAAIMAISDQVSEETSTTVAVESKYHRTLIGAGGQGLKDLVSRCGGPSDPKLQAGLIRFPRQGDVAIDEVRLRGEPKLVAKLKVELEKAVANLKDRVVLAIEIPATQHRALIGRGGQHLNDLQNRTDVQVQFPGSRSYNQVGEAENAADFKDVDAANIVKISGTRAACDKAMEELKAQVKPAAVEITSSVTVPLKYHHVISQQGGFFRTLRSYGVQVDQSAQPQKSAVPPQPSANGSTARIDETEDEVAVQWEITANYQDAEEGESTWTLKARDQAGLERAEKAIKEAIEHAGRMSHVGFLTLPDRSMFPRIVGSKGANVARLRHETGADITVSRENSTIVILGSEKDILAAKVAITRMTSNSGRPQRRPQD